MRFTADHSLAIAALQDPEKVRSPHEVLVFVRVLSTAEILVLSNPFGLYRLNLDRHTLDRWDEGLPPPEEGISGPLRFAETTDGFFSGHPSALYRRRATDMTWARDPRAATDGLAPRALSVSPWHPDALVVANHRSEILEIDPSGAVTHLWRETERATSMIIALHAEGDALMASFVHATPPNAGLILRNFGKEVEQIVLPTDL